MTIKLDSSRCGFDQLIAHSSLHRTRTDVSRRNDQWRRGREERWREENIRRETARQECKQAGEIKAGQTERRRKTDWETRSAVMSDRCNYFKSPTYWAHARERLYSRSRSRPSYYTGEWPQILAAQIFFYWRLKGLSKVCDFLRKTALAFKKLGAAPGFNCTACYGDIS